MALVHGLFADCSSWRKIIPLIQNKGLKTVVVKNPLTSLADDVAATTRSIDPAPEPIIPVGYSRGGVTSEAGNNEKVMPLVYIAAFALSKDESINDLHKNYPKPEWFGSAILDSSGFSTLPPDAISSFFAQDLPAEKKQSNYFV